MTCCATFSSGVRGVLICAVLSLVLLNGNARAEAPVQTVSTRLPKGFVIEQNGPITWTFPASARSKIKELQEFQRSAWKRIRREFGGKIQEDLEIRVGLNPDQMQALAPDDTQLPKYAIGIALPKLGVILLTLTAPETWKLTDLESVMVHELSHMALHRVVNGSQVPRWFSEGIAIHQAGENSFSRTRVLWMGTLQKELIPLEQLSVAFPSQQNKVNLAYAQSADFVGFLIDGEDNQYHFYELLENLRNGTTFSKAIYSAYKVPQGYLEREWRRTLQRRFGRWALLLTGMGTLWSLASILLIIGYVKTRRKHMATLKRWENEELRLDKEFHASFNQPAPSENPQIDPLQRQQDTSRSSGIPTIKYEGEDHTLH